MDAAVTCIVVDERIAFPHAHGRLVGPVLVDELDRVERRCRKPTDAMRCDERQISRSGEDRGGHVAPLGSRRRAHLLDHGVRFVQRRNDQPAHLVGLVRIDIARQQLLLDVRARLDSVVFHDRRVRRVEHLVVLDEPIEQFLLLRRQLHVFVHWVSPRIRWFSPRR